MEGRKEMLAELKRDFRLLKYIPQFKMNVIMSIVIFLMGIPMLILAKANFVQVSVMYLLLGATLLQSNLYTLLRTDMIASSDRRRYLDGPVANLIIIVGSAVAYILVSIRVLVGFEENAEVTDPRKVLIVSVAILIIEIVYCGLAYKSWWISSVIFFVVVMIFMTNSPQELIGTLPDIPLGVIIIIGAVAVGLANVIACVVRKRLYRRDMTFTKNINMNKTNK